MDKKILLFSAGRTGSTLVYRILKLLGFQVFKAHQKEMREIYEDGDLDCVITERDRVDSYISRLRCVYCDGDPKKLLKNIDELNFLMSDIVSYKMEIEYVEVIKKQYRGRKLILDYSKFFDNYDYIFDEIESFFGINIDENKKKEIKKKVNREESIRKQKKLGTSFSKMSEDTMLHGNHIWSQKNGYSKNLLQKEKYNQLKEILYYEKNKN